MNCAVQDIVALYKMTGRIFRVLGQEPQMEHLGREEECIHTGEKYVAFYRIPYGKPPKGKKRYQAPEPLTSPQPTNVQEGSSASSTSSSEGPTASTSVPQKADVVEKSCIQPPNFEGSSDCLYLNVYLPSDPDLIEKLLPVLVFIHGGGFIKGSSDPDKNSPENIIKEDLVFVTINYRLGPSGFLNLRTKEVPGNAGLKDQVLALKWIRDNIKCFKGDPSNVTISGSSSGATCVNLHMISPMSKGLFHKAILQSGGIFFVWGYLGHQFEQKKLFEGDEKLMSMLYDEKKEKELDERSFKVQVDKRNNDSYSFYSIHGPTVEKIREGAFIPDEIEKMMEDVHELNIPVMAGITKNEALESFITSDFDTKEFVEDDEEFHKFLMDNFRWSKMTATVNADKIRNKYFPTRELMSSEDMYHCFTELLRDVYVRNFYDCFKFGPMKILHRNLFIYRFDHFSEISSLSLIDNWNGKREATHGDESKYLYCPTEIREKFRAEIYEEQSQNIEIQEVMNHICSLWANFCKTGTPSSDFDSNVEWKRYSEGKPCYLNISNNLVLKDGSILDDRCDWLNDLVNFQPTVPSQKATPEKN